MLIFGLVRGTNGLPGVLWVGASLVDADLGGRVNNSCSCFTWQNPFGNSVGEENTKVLFNDLFPTVLCAGLQSDSSGEKKG